MMRSFTAWSLGNQLTGLPSILTRALQNGRSHFSKARDSLQQIAWPCSPFPRPWIMIPHWNLPQNLHSIFSYHWEQHRGVCRLTWPEGSPWTWDTVLSCTRSHRNLAVLHVTEYKNGSRNQKIHMPSSFHLFLINMTVKVVETWRTQQKYFNLHVGTQPR